jgi:GNAT superfamily N-acetyltransferase
MIGESGMPHSNHQGPNNSIECRTLSSDLWADFVSLMESDPQCSECWCLNHRMKSPCPTNKVAKNMMQTMVANNAVHGLLAYRGAECVGWVAVDPMQTLAGHDCQRTNSTGEWSIHCLFVKTGFRGQGISTKLIEAAIRHAQSNGASLVSAFPIPAASRSNYPAHEAEFSGRYSTYFKLGFRPTGGGDSFYQRVELPLTDL